MIAHGRLGLGSHITLGILLAASPPLTPSGQSEIQPLLRRLAVADSSCHRVLTLECAGLMGLGRHSEKE
ncbi:hypothetical protein RRG08_008997 [Elysia crispata]|uniref:Secreted protein n=1 Tax=Elysia crispata TaxID=231223 RepID=A0AAE0YU31_9GAST|nr:hypothetical protein RRG08_008997 [Elysia crispata]